MKNDIGNKNKIMFKHLEHMPFYVIPAQVMALTPDQIRGCTVGTQNLMSGSLGGSIPREKTLAGSIVVARDTQDINEIFVDPDCSQSSLVQNLVSLPSVVLSYQNREKEQETEKTFAYEDPTMVNFEALEPTSGRKQWKIKHHKSIKKKAKAFKNGFQGN